MIETSYNTEDQQLAKCSIISKTEKPKRITKDALYVIEENRCSVLGNWSKEQSIINPAIYKKGYFPRHLVIGEFKPDNRMYRLDDGHLPEFQPVVKGTDLKRVLIEKNMKQAFLVCE